MPLEFSPRERPTIFSVHLQFAVHETHTSSSAFEDPRVLPIANADQASRTSPSKLIAGEWCGVGRG